MWLSWSSYQNSIAKCNMHEYYSLSRQKKELTCKSKPQSIKSFYLFAEAERDVLVLDHVGDLAPHGENKENDPIAQQNWPKHRNVKHREECHEEGYAESLCHGVPETTIHNGIFYQLTLMSQDTMVSSIFIKCIFL